MAKLRFNYGEPIQTEITGAEVDPVCTINTETGELHTRFFERIKRLDTGEEVVVYDRPHTVVITLTPADIEAMMQVPIMRAMEQGKLRPATPVVELPEEPPPPPPPAPEPARVRVTPSIITVAPGEVVQFTAETFNVEDTTVIWSLVDDQAGGSITQAGSLTAPNVPGDYRVMVQLAVEPMKSSVAIVTVE